MNPDNANRLLLGLIEALNVSPEEAEKTLASLTLRIVATPAVTRSAAAQAALLTALNTAKRCFLGGVRIDGVPEAVPLRVPYRPYATLNEVVRDLLPQNLESSSFSETIFVGEQIESTQSHDWVVHCAGWRGGVTVGRLPIEFENDGQADFCLGGVFAGALAVHHAFFRAANLSQRLEEPQGLSLWTLGENWTKLSENGPPLEYLPSALWLIGLGHLGQAYLWVLSLLPFKSPEFCRIMLQDFDVLKKANLGAGLLSRADEVGWLKTRICRNWLDSRGFTNSTICDRAFDEKTIRSAVRAREEPHIALCGLDNTEGRWHLGGAGFRYVLDCGLGGWTADFDHLGTHVFPNTHNCPTELWKDDGPQKPSHARFKILKKSEGECRALPLATVSISASFVGAVAASLVIAELLRMHHGGIKCFDGDFPLRSPDRRQFCIEAAAYDPVDMAKYGVLEYQ